MIPTYSIHPYRPGTRVQRPPVPRNEYDGHVDHPMDTPDPDDDTPVSIYNDPT